MLTRRPVATLLLAVALALQSCAPTANVKPSSAATVGATSQAERLKSIYDQLGAAGGTVYTLKPALSMVKIYVFRGGRAAGRGHNHVLSAPQFVGYVYLPSSGLSTSRFDIELRLDQLAIDDPQYRAGLGDAFATTPTEQDIQGTRDHMLGERNLQANQFPFVFIRSLAVVGEAPKLAAKCEIELHGQKREVWVPLNVEHSTTRLTVAGAFVLRQTDFGIEPYSVFGGLLAVQDEIVVEFSLVGS